MVSCMSYNSTTVNRRAATAISGDLGEGLRLGKTQGPRGNHRDEGEIEKGDDEKSAGLLASQVYQYIGSKHCLQSQLLPRHDIQPPPIPHYAKHHSGSRDSANKYHPYNLNQIEIGGARNGICGFGAQTYLGNLGRGVGGAMGCGGGHHSCISSRPIPIECDCQQANLKAQAIAQLPNQSLIDQLRLDIVSIQNQIHMSTKINPPGSVNIAGLFQEEARLKQKLYKYLLL